MLNPDYALRQEKGLMKKLSARQRKRVSERLTCPRPTPTGNMIPINIVTSFQLGIWIATNRYIHCDWLRFDKVLKVDIRLGTDAFAGHIQQVFR